MKQVKICLVCSLLVICNLYRDDIVHLQYREELFKITWLLIFLGLVVNVFPLGAKVLDSNPC